jgi:hypothetical protein
MKRLCTGLSLIVLGVVLCTALADAQPRADPFHAGFGSVAYWSRDIGKPAGGDSLQHGLYLQRGIAIQKFFSVAGASISVPIAGLTMTNMSDLSFQISGIDGIPEFGLANGFCEAEAPRFTVVTSSGGKEVTCYLGCAMGDKTQVVAPDQGAGWWTIAFHWPFSDYHGCENAEPAGKLVSITVNFDELITLVSVDPPAGTSPGNVVLDNITIKRCDTGNTPCSTASRVNSAMIGNP